MSLDVRVNVGTKKASSNVNRFTKKAASDVKVMEKQTVASAGKMATAFSGVSSVLLGFGLLGAGRGLVSLKNQASDLSESINAVNVVFGEGADIILRFGQQAAEAVGLANSEFNQLATVTGALLEGTGKSLDEVSNITIELTQRAADLASVFNTSVQDALSAVNAAVRGESEAIRRFAGDVTDASLKSHLLAEGINTTVTSLSEQEKRLLRIEVLMAQTDKVANDFKNTSGELANQERILNSNLKDLAADMGAFLIPVFLEGTSLLLSMTKGFVDLRQEAAKFNKTDEEFLSRQAQALAAQEEFLTLRIATSERDKEILDLLTQTEGLRQDDLNSVRTQLVVTVDLLNIEKQAEQAKTLEKEKQAAITQRQNQLLERELELTMRIGESTAVLPIAIEEASQSFVSLAEGSERYANASARALVDWDIANGVFDDIDKSTNNSQQAAGIFARHLFNAAQSGRSLADIFNQLPSAIIQLIIGLSTGGVGGGLGSFLGSFDHGGSVNFNTGSNGRSKLFAFQAHDGEDVSLNVSRPGDVTNNSDNRSVSNVNNFFGTTVDQFFVETKLLPMINQAVSGGSILRSSNA